MKFRLWLVALLVLSIVVACNNDDGPGGSTVTLRDRTEQQIVDNDSLLGYFNTHVYNYEFLEAQEDINIFDIDIVEAAVDGNGELIIPQGYKLLADEMGADGKLITIVDDIPYEGADYTYYVLKLNEGGGTFQPDFADTVQMVYEGTTMDASVFDSEGTLSVPFTLTNLIEGWKRTIPMFKTAESYEIEGGFTTYKNYGTGVLFIPSGLGYYGRQQGQIPPYSNLIFKIGLMRGEVSDQDQDGLASNFEDINGNLSLIDDDSDGDGIPDYLDLDDDGDLVPTEEEDLNGDGDYTNDDTDGDGIPNYLDDDDDGDGVPTRNEDIDGDGDPTNDIGANGIPKYLDPTETESNQG